MDQIKDPRNPDDIKQQLEAIRRENKVFKIAVISLLSAAILIFGYWNKQTQGYASLNADAYSADQVGASSGGGCGGGSGSGCGGGAGGGCGSGSSQQIASPELEKQALALFADQSGEIEGVQAKVLDLGCHQEVDIVDKGGNLLQRYSYRDGQLTPL